MNIMQDHSTVGNGIDLVNTWKKMCISIIHQEECIWH